MIEQPVAAAATAAARVTPSGSHLVVSNRIVGAPGALSAVPLLPSGEWEADVKPAITSTLGRTPRDFALLGPPSASAGKRKRKAGDEGVVALAANQDTDEIALLCEGAEPKVLTKAVPTPVCLCVL